MGPSKVEGKEARLRVRRPGSWSWLRHCPNPPLLAERPKSSLRKRWGRGPRWIQTLDSWSCHIGRSHTRGIPLSPVGHTVSPSKGPFSPWMCPILLPPLCLFTAPTGPGTSSSKCRTHYDTGILGVHFWAQIPKEDHLIGQGCGQTERWAVRVVRWPSPNLLSWGVGVPSLTVRPPRAAREAVPWEGAVILIPSQPFTSWDIWG